jgi:tetratricopeptide (TPR) repeat protein
LFVEVTLTGTGLAPSAGELAAKHKKFDQAIVHLQNAVRLEDALTYDEPPPWYTPARHNFGAVLLEAGRAVEAQKIYEDDLKKYPEKPFELWNFLIEQFQVSFT